MIVPYLLGVLNFRQVPATWLFVGLNSVVFITLLPNQLRQQHALEKLYEDTYFMNTQTQVFASYIVHRPEKYSYVMQQLAKGALAGSQRKSSVLGMLSLRDPVFFSEVEIKEETMGDLVAIQFWKEKKRELSSVMEASHTHQYGLSQRSGFTSFFSYQFIHGDVFHLFTNMFFLLIFGCAIEPIVGALGFTAVYLLGGVGAALIFSETSGLSALPLIGASGSVSAVMGLFAAVYGRKPMQFFFWVLPTKNYFGFIYLPAWIAVAMWAILDVAGIVGTLPEFGGTAHAAHLGGLLMGILAGVVMKKHFEKLSPATEISRQAQ